jgi:sugar transferase (PEP-CTERM/EpsH1 system associated)
LSTYLRIPELRGTPKVIDLIDVDSEKWYEYATASSGPRSWLYRLEASRLRRLEQDLATWTKAITLVSDPEVGLFRRFCARGSVHAVGNGVDLEYFHPHPSPSDATCVFVGALDYRPNVDGVIWFCKTVWPEVRRRRPDASLALVGRNPAPAVRALAAMPSVNIVGQVPDIRPHVARAAVAIAPLQIARGVQNKVLEALAMNRAVVASLPALEGLAAEPGRHLVAATTTSEWVDCLVQLFADPRLRDRLGAAGRQYVEEHHRWERCLDPLGPLLGLPTVHAPRHLAPVAG